MPAQVLAMGLEGEITDENAVMADYGHCCKMPRCSFQCNLHMNIEAFEEMQRVKNQGAVKGVWDVGQEFSCRGNGSG